MVDENESQLTCPEYSDLVTSSMDTFSVSEYSGIWFLAATTDSKLLTSCHCGVDIVVVDEASAMYNKQILVTCNIRGNTTYIDSAGELNNPEPGNFGVENMIFSVVRDGVGGQIDFLFTYSCLGIVDGSEKFSFNMLSRSHELGQEEIESLVQDAVTSSQAELDIAGLRITTFTEYEGCYGGTNCTDALPYVPHPIQLDDAEKQICYGLEFSNYSPKYQNGVPP
jgi:hypothetical protein